MRITRAWGLIPPVIGAALIGCAAETSSPAVADHFEVVAGGAQRGVLGMPLDTQVQVRLIGSDGAPMTGVPVRWEVTDGGGTFIHSSDSTGVGGLAVANWTLGLGLGDQAIQLSALDLPPVRITAAAPPLVLDQLATGFGFACGIDHDGVTWCWGSNFGGTLGTADLNNSLVPQRIGGDSLRFVQLALGDSHACGRTVAGAVWCWGADYQGQLGDGRIGAYDLSSATPIQPIGLPPLAMIDAADLGTCGVDFGGGLWCWGNGGGQPGHATPSNLFPGTQFARVAIGRAFACGILTGGQVVCWGLNTTGQLGQGTIGASSPVPVPIQASITAVDLAAGDDGACAITPAHELYCWGAMINMPGHNFGDSARALPSISSEDSPATRVSLKWVCGAVWHGIGSPRPLCGAFGPDIEGLPSITDVEFGTESMCLRVGLGATYCKSYSDAPGAPPFAFTGTGIPAP